MEHRYINLAYEKTHNAKIENVKEIDGVVYALPASTNVFFGTDKIIGDKFKLNGEKPDAKEINDSIYFKTNSNELKFEIDFNNRLDLMQQITANAIVRLIINRTTNLNVIDYQITANDNKIIIAANDISFSQIEKIESTSNHLILSNLSTNNTGDRIIIRGYGSMESIGPVCERIGELGLIKIKSLSKNSDNICLHLVSGSRAINDYFAKSNIIESLESILNVDQDNILKKVKELKFGSSKTPILKNNFDTDLNKDNSAKNTGFTTTASNKSINDNNNIKPSEPIETDKDISLNSALIESEEKENHQDNDTSQVTITDVSRVNSLNPTTEITNAENTLDKDGAANVGNSENLQKNISKEALKMSELATDVDEFKFIYKVFRNTRVQDVINNAREITNLPNYIEILGFPIGDVSNFYVTRSKNLNIDLKNILQTINPKLFMKSSGNMFEVEGTVSTQNLATVMESFLLKIKN